LGRGLGWGTPEVPANPNHAGILGFPALLCSAKLSRVRFLHSDGTSLIPERTATNTWAKPVSIPVFPSGRETPAPWRSRLCWAASPFPAEGNDVAGGAGASPARGGSTSASPARVPPRGRASAPSREMVTSPQGTGFIQRQPRHPLQGPSSGRYSGF